jgi:hypothetical protein
MEQNLSYVSISELIKMAKHDAAPQRSNSDQTLALIERAFHSIDDMTIEDREEVMRRLTAWMLVEKFEAKGHSALVGFQRYCILECLSDDPDWSPPKDVVAGDCLPDAY